MPKLPKITNLQSPCDISRKELSYEVDVLYADKHESLLQVDTIFYEVGQACLSTRTSLKCLCDVLR